MSNIITTSTKTKHPNAKGAIFDLTNTTNLMYYRCINKGGNKNMTRTFIETPIFTAKWQDLGLTDKNLKDLQEILLEKPKLGDTISHTGGLRKIRIPMENKGKGKRSGARVIYVDVDIKETVYLVNVYSKDEKADLTPDEKKALKAVVKILKEE